MLAVNHFVQGKMVVDGFNDLIQAHEYLVADYQMALSGLESHAYKKVFGDFLKNHSESVQTLAQIANTYGDRVENETRMDDALVAHGVSKKASGDRAILEEMKAHEERLKFDYSRSLASLPLSDQLESPLQRNRGDVIKRLGWFEGELNMLAHAPETDGD